MNFRTTIVLAVALLAAFLVVFFTKDKDASETTKSKTEEKKLLEGWSEANVARVALTQPEGKRVVIERSGDHWRLKEPVESRADNFQAGSLARAVAEMTTRGEADASKVSAAALDKPSYVAELADKGGKTVKVSFGARPPLGDDLVVKVEGPDAGKVRTELVDASVLDRIKEEPERFRDTSLVEAKQEEVQRIAITRPEGPLVLEKKGGDWTVTEPKAMPADSTEVSSLLSSLTSLRAEDFVKPSTTHPRGYGLKDPAMTVSLLVQPAPLPSTNPAVTQPTTKPSTTTVIKFGDPVDIRRKQIYAAVGDGPIAKVSAMSLEAFKKTPLELRNREVLDIDPNAVSKVTISTDKPAATQPVVKPPMKHEVVLERRSESQPATAPAPKVSEVPAETTPDGSGVVTLAGLQEAPSPAPAPAQASAPAKAATGPTTKPTTGPTTKPSTGPTTHPAGPAAPPQSKWVITSDPKGDADDAKVAALLGALYPLRVEKFIESWPTSQPTPAATYVIRVHTRSWGDEPGREHELKIADPGGAAKLVGTIGELTFELERTAIEPFTTDFAAPKIQPAGPVFAPPSPAPAPQ